MTTSAEIAGFELLRKSGYTAAQLADAKLSAEQARDVIFFATGVRIPAGLIEAELSRCRQGGGPTESAEDAAGDFRRDTLGDFHARMTGRSAASTTDLYKLIAQKV